MAKPPERMSRNTASLTNINLSESSPPPFEESSIQELTKMSVEKGILKKKKIKSKQV
jgi:hypothetical protein